MFNNFAIFLLALSAAVPGILAYEFERFVSSSLAGPNEFPYMAGVMVKNNGTVPNNCQLEPTACIIDKKDELNNIRIRTGTNSLLDNQGETHEVERYHLHNMSITKAHTTAVYTIGVYRLKTPLKVNDKQKPIRFAALPENIITRDPGGVDKFFSGSWYGTVVGWGTDNSAQSTGNLNVPPTLRKMQDTVIIERVPRCKRFIEQYGIPYSGHEICGYIDGKIGNDGAALIYYDTFIGVAIYYKYEFKDWFDGSEGYGSIFAYIKQLENFISATVADY
ncbi:uncharacterized protein [Prorops nasuta]|uniref:uncharacterized protein n=1 Tax=Prorops nasuta TaxID=863751 RepID=UPI0034CF534C